MDLAGKRAQAGPGVMMGWVRNLVGFYGAGELVDYGRLKHAPAWVERGLARPAAQRGLDIPKRAQ